MYDVASLYWMSVFMKIYLVKVQIWTKIMMKSLQ